MGKISELLTLCFDLREVWKELTKGLYKAGIEEEDIIGI
jgi:hypothetical protein